MKDMGTAVQDRLSSPSLEGAVYVLTATTTAIGTWLAVHEFLPKPPAAEVIMWVGGAVIAPATAILIGYINGPFSAGALIGGLPVIGLMFGGFLRGFTLRGIESGLAAAFIPASISIPVSGGLYVLGVTLRRDGTFTRRKRGLAIRMAAAIIIGLTLGLLVHLGVVEIFGDH
jgi:hypothetical protein